MPRPIPNRNHEMSIQSMSGGILSDLPEHFHQVARSRAPKPKPTEPIRIIVITTTHLVPGKWYNDKIDFLTDLVCKARWGRKFNAETDRRATKDCVFGYSGRKCYFMLDHLGSGDKRPDWEALEATGGDRVRVMVHLDAESRKMIEDRKIEKTLENEDIVEVPVKQYRWDGKKLIRDYTMGCKIYYYTTKVYKFPVPEDRPTTSLQQHRRIPGSGMDNRMLNKSLEQLHRLECLSMPGKRDLLLFWECPELLSWFEDKLGERGEEGKKVFAKFRGEMVRAQMERKEKSRIRYV